jgi:hypothetical protein
MKSWQLVDEMTGAPERTAGCYVRPAWTAALRLIEAEILASSRSGVTWV